MHPEPSANWVQTKPSGFPGVFVVMGLDPRYEVVRHTTVVHHDSNLSRMVRRASDRQWHDLLVESADQSGETHSQTDDVGQQGGSFDGAVAGLELDEFGDGQG